MCRRQKRERHVLVRPASEAKSEKPMVKIETEVQREATDLDIQVVGK